MKQLKMIPLFFALAFLLSQEFAFAATIEVPLVVTSGAQSYTLRFGVAPWMHFCWDLADTLNGHQEMELPPPRRRVLCGHALLTLGSFPPLTALRWERLMITGLSSTLRSETHLRWWRSQAIRLSLLPGRRTSSPTSARRGWCTLPTACSWSRLTCLQTPRWICRTLKMVNSRFTRLDLEVFLRG